MVIYRATSAQVDLEAFQHNLRIIKSIVDPNVATMAIIKADAYGHGAIPCARAALKEGVNYLGVGIIQEGIELRESGISSPILILGGVYPNELEDLIKYYLSTSLSNSKLAQAISKKAELAGKNVGVHIKVDTGMGRLGVQPKDFTCLLDSVMNYKNLKLEGIFTHLACADEKDPETTHNQIIAFSRVLEELHAIKISKLLSTNGPLLIHSANTAGLLRFPKSRFNMVRPGISLYGSLPSPVLNPALNESLKEKGLNKLQPVMQWKTKVIQVQTLKKGVPVSYGQRYVTRRDSRIATLPVGYADGLSRRLSNNMEFLIKAKRVKQVGTICMDMCLVDITDIPDIEIGEEAVIFGSQGKSQILVEELAAQAETIPYEILCGVGKRVPRIYIS